jgi:hypothetical protein
MPRDTGSLKVHQHQTRKQRLSNFNIDSFPAEVCEME